MKKLLRNTMISLFAAAIMFTGCENDSSDDTAYIPHATLPESVGEEDPFAGKTFADDDTKFVAGTDRTIEEYRIRDNEEKPECLYSYSYDTGKKELYLAIKLTTLSGEELMDYSASVSWMENSVQQLNDTLKTLDKESAMYSATKKIKEELEKEINAGYPMLKRTFENVYTFSYDMTNGLALTQKFTGVDSANFEYKNGNTTDSFAIDNISVYYGTTGTLSIIDRNKESPYSSYYLKSIIDNTITFVNMIDSTDEITASYTLNENTASPTLTVILNLSAADSTPLTLDFAPITYNLVEQTN